MNIPTVFPKSNNALKDTFMYFTNEDFFSKEEFIHSVIFLDFCCKNLDIQASNSGLPNYKILSSSTQCKPNSSDVISRTNILECNHSFTVPKIICIEYSDNYLKLSFMEPHDSIKHICLRTETYRNGVIKKTYFNERNKINYIEYFHETEKYTYKNGQFTF